MICTYQDYAEEEEVETSTALTEKLDQDGSEQVVFPVKLHSMLREVEKKGLAHVVGWAPHGRCFLVHDKEEFVSRILASWFRQSKFASFQRQLNLYGFKRITTGQDKGGYYHELFLRGKMFLCHRIERVKIKGSKPGRIKAYADAEPDFYRMPPLPADPTQDDGDSNKLQQREGNAGGVGDVNSEVRSAPPASAAHGLDVGSGRTQPLVQAHDQMNLTFMGGNPSAGGISFLGGEPLPMPVARNSPPIDEDADMKPHAAEPANSGLYNLMQSGTGSTSLTAGLKQPQSSETQDQSHSSAFRLLPNTLSSLGGNNSGNSGTTNSNAGLSSLHPMLEASGRTNLVNLRDSSSGIFGTAGFPMSGQTLPSFMSQPNQLSFPFSSSGFANAPGQQQLQQQQQQAQQPQQQQQGQEHRLSLGFGGMEMIPAPNVMLNMPNAFILSQSLPTAESLALEDLFDSQKPNVAAATTSSSVVSNIPALLMQQTQQQQQQAMPFAMPPGIPFPQQGPLAQLPPLQSQQAQQPSQLQAQQLQPQQLLQPQQPQQLQPQVQQLQAQQQMPNLSGDGSVAGGQAESRGEESGNRGNSPETVSGAPIGQGGTSQGVDARGMVHPQSPASSHASSSDSSVHREAVV